MPREHRVFIIEHNEVRRRSGLDADCRLPACQRTTFVHARKQFAADMAFPQGRDIAGLRNKALSVFEPAEFLERVD